MKADGELRRAIALIEQRLANCSILHSQDNSDAEWIDGVCITPSIAVQDIMRLIQAERANAALEEAKEIRKHIEDLRPEVYMALQRIDGHIAALHSEQKGEA